MSGAVGSCRWGGGAMKGLQDLGCCCFGLLVRVRYQVDLELVPYKVGLWSIYNLHHKDVYMSSRRGGYVSWRCIAGVCLHVVCSCLFCAGCPEAHPSAMQVRPATGTCKAVQVCVAPGFARDLRGGQTGLLLTALIQLFTT